MRRWAKFALLLVASWCVMTVTHEAGHLVGGWVGGATLRQADLRPWHLPYSLFDPDPRPLLTLWSGPVLGVGVPLLAALLVRQRWLWFIAYFCILANGVYLAMAAITGDSQLDTARLLASGASPITIAAFCLVTIGAGYLGFRRQCREVLRGSQPSESP